MQTPNDPSEKRVIPRRGLQLAAALLLLGCVVLSHRTRSTMPESAPIAASAPAPAPEAVVPPEAVPDDPPVVEPGPVTFAGQTYRVATEEGGVVSALPTGETLRLALHEIRVGERTIVQGGTAAPRRAGRDGFSYDRGTVEERYRFREREFEQDFILRELPEGRGEITVEQILQTDAAPPPANVPSPSLEFRARPDAAFIISKAVAIDAADRRLPLDLVYAGGRLKMTVPEEWVRDAELPIVIDPLVGGLIILASPVGWQNGARMDLAYGKTANEYMAVFYDGFNTSWNIYTRRISAAGAVLGAATLNGGVAIGNSDCCIAYSASLNKYLAVWAESGSGSFYYLAGRFLDGVGTPLGTEFRVGTYTNFPSNTAIAADASGNFLAVAQIGSTLIEGAVINNAGTVTARPQIQTTNTPTTPKVAFCNGEYLVAWSDSLGVQARGVSTTGGLITPVTLLAGGSSTVGGVSTGNNQFLVTWKTYTTLYTLYGRVVQANSAAALAFATPTFTIASNVYDGVPAWSAVSSLWFVAATAANRDTVSYNVTPAGGVSGPTFIATQPTRDSKVAWSSTANDVLVMFHRDATPTQSNFQIAAQLFNIGPMPPPAPANLVATSGNTMVTLNWSASPGATGYKVFRALSPGGYGATPVATVTSTTFTDTGLTNGTFYYYVVKASNAAGDSAASNEVLARPVPPPPPAPTGLTATAGNAQVVLTWTAAPGAASYYVKRSLTPGGPYTTIAGLSPTTYTNTGLENGRTYYYVVSANNLGGEGPISAEVNATPMLPPPAIVSVTSNTANGSYRAGAAINITVNFTEPVTLVGGNLQIALNTGATVSIPPFGPSSSASWTYTVAAGQNTADLNATSPLTLSAGTLRNSAGVNVALAIPAGQNIANLKAIVIDTTAPTISNVTSTTANGSYTTGAGINITVTFSEPVILAGGNLQVTLSTGTVVSLTPFGPASTRAGTYTVAAGQSSPDLNAVTPLVLVTGATIKDVAGNSLASLAVPAGQNLANLKAIVIDTTAGSIVQVTSTTADGLYGVGAAINIQVTFTEPVTLAGGNLQVALNTGITVSIPPFTAQTVVNATYTVGAGQNTSDLNATSPLGLSGGTLRDVAGNTIPRTIPAGKNIADLKAIAIKTPPLPPTNIRVTVYATAVDVEWDPSPSPASSVAGYNVYRRAPGTAWPATPLNRIAPLNGVILNTKFRDTTAAINTTYEYEVRAVGP